MIRPVGVIDYGAGNIGSVVNMLRHVGADTRIIQSINDLRLVRGVVLPGVGHFDRGVRQLRLSGIFDKLTRWNDSMPSLMGICLGMQLLMSSSEEGSELGLGLIPGTCVRFRAREASDKIPHMGWNSVRALRPGSALDSQSQSSRYYFVHSYHAQPLDESHHLGTSNYLGEFCSAVTNGAGVTGYQFHPEKSHRYGMALIREFVRAAC